LVGVKFFCDAPAIIYRLTKTECFSGMIQLHCFMLCLTVVAWSIWLSGGGDNIEYTGLTNYPTTGVSKLRIYEFIYCL